MTRDFIYSALLKGAVIKAIEHRNNPDYALYFYDGASVRVKTKISQQYETTDTPVEMIATNLFGSGSFANYHLIIDWSNVVNKSIQEVNDD